MKIALEITPNLEPLFGTRDENLRLMEDTLGVRIDLRSDAFYAFPSVAKFGLPAKEFSLQLLREEKVAVVPGSAFGACGEGFVRCAYATSMDNIKEAMTRLRRFIARHQV